jgi:hypothetical protein
MVARSGDSALGCAGQAPPFLAGHASRPVQVLYSLITVDRGLGHPSIDGIRECLGDVEAHGSFA